MASVRVTSLHSVICGIVTELVLICVHPAKAGMCLVRLKHFDVGRSAAVIHKGAFGDGENECRWSSEKNV